MAENKSDRIIVDKDFQIQNVEDVFYKYKAILIDALTENLIKYDKDQPGRLLQSINVDILIQNKRITFELSMEDYWKWVDQGRKKGAKMPPIDAILEFIKVRGIGKLSERRNKQIKRLRNKTVRKSVKQLSLEKKRKSIAFAIARSIKKKGIKPTHFYSDVVNASFKDKLKADLVKALKKDVEIVFRDIKNELQ